MAARVRIATRSSRLALWQANHVRDRLLANEPSLVVELVEVQSTGDIVRDRPLHHIGGVGVFTKEVQDALLDGRADVAVHSLKDLPTEPHPALVLAAVPPRGPVEDVLLAPRYRMLDQLPAEATVATSSLRRRSQLLRHRPDLQVVDIRGNVETRIRKLHDQGLDGLVLAKAGVDRLGLESEVTQTLSVDIMMPAVGQGALGIECRAEDAALRTRLAGLDDVATHRAVLAERSFLRRLEGGCHVPIAAIGQVANDTVRLRGVVLDAEGRRWFEGSLSGPAVDANEVGKRLADQLLAEGAGDLLGLERP